MGLNLEHALSYRGASEADKDYLRSLHRKCYYDVVTSQFGSWNEKRQQEFFERTWAPAKYKVIQWDGQDVGVLATQPAIDYLFLAEIQIDPAFQNQGIGSAVLRELISSMRSIGKPIRLQVLLASKATAFYRRLGFVEISQTDTHRVMDLFPKVGI